MTITFDAKISLVTGEDDVEVEVGYDTSEGVLWVVPCRAIMGDPDADYDEGEILPSSWTRLDEKGAELARDQEADRSRGKR